jgi:hypothetical protein
MAYAAGRNLTIAQHLCLPLGVAGVSDTGRSSTLISESVLITVAFSVCRALR